jgi:predicted phosphoribosyltransferase
MTDEPRFRDRRDAGGWLAVRLSALALRHPVVLALPRGGIHVGAEVARALRAPFDVCVVARITHPDKEDLALGAVAEGDVVVLTEDAHRSGLERAVLQDLAEQARREVRRRVVAYRGERQLPDLRGRDVVLVDDGMETGITAEAALKSLRRQRPSRLVLAVPVCAEDSHARLGRVADDVICVLTPPDSPFRSWYDELAEATDEQVLELLSGSTS